MKFHSLFPGFTDQCKNDKQKDPNGKTCNILIDQRERESHKGEGKRNRRRRKEKFGSPKSPPLSLLIAAKPNLEPSPPPPPYPYNRTQNNKCKGLTVCRRVSSQPFKPSSVLLRGRKGGRANPKRDYAPPSPPRFRDAIGINEPVLSLMFLPLFESYPPPPSFERDVVLFRFNHKTVAV